MDHHRDFLLLPLTCLLACDWGNLAETDPGPDTATATTTIPLTTTSTSTSTSTSGSSSTTTDTETSSTSTETHSTTSSTTDSGTTGMMYICGDGHKDPGEACDDGNTDNTDACVDMCKAATCGDSYVQKDVEQCDDGNSVDDDACSIECVAAKCGDGVLQAAAGEACDDGNLLPGDGCDAACARETLLVFVSSTKFEGNLLPSLDNKQGLALADAHCQALASQAGLQGSFMAWLADGAQGPKDRFSLPDPYSGLFTLTNGTLLASGWQDLTDGSLDHPIDVDETGASVSSSTVWTNTKPDGSSAGSDHCMGWSSSDIGIKGRIGGTSKSDALWTDFDLNSCANSARLYCFQVP